MCKGPVAVKCLVCLRKNRKTDVVGRGCMETKVVENVINDQSRYYCKWQESLLVFLCDFLLTGFFPRISHENIKTCFSLY